MSYFHRAEVVNRLGGQAAIFLIGNVFTLLVGFPLQVFVARQVGAEGLGLYSLGDGIVTVIASLLGFGVAPALVKYIPLLMEQRAYSSIRQWVLKGGELLLVAGMLVFILTLALFPLMVSFWPQLAGQYSLVFTMGWLLPLSLILFFLQQALRGFYDIHHIVIGNSFIQLAVKSVLTVLFLLLGYGLLGYVWAVVISTLSAGFWLGMGLRKKLADLPSSADADIASFREVKAYALTLYKNSLMGLGAVYLDRFLLGALIGPAPVGILLVVKQLQQLPVIFLQMFISVAAPMFSAAHARNNAKERDHIYHLTTDWVVRLSIPLFIFFSIFSTPLLQLYGTEFVAEGRSVLWVLLASQMVNLGFGPLGTILSMSGFEQLQLKLAAWDFLLSTITLLLLVPTYGLLGVASSIAILVVFQNVVTYWFARVELGLRWYDKRYLQWAFPLFSTLLVGFAIHRVSPDDPGPLALLLYLLSFYVVFHGCSWLQGFNKDDLELIDHLLAKAGLRLPTERFAHGPSPIGLLPGIKQIVPASWSSRIADWRGRGVYSIYADEFECIFIHVPKAAGTSVALTLFGQNSRHLPWWEYRNANPRKFGKFYKFTFVRNPWDRLVSTYFFLQRGGMDPQDKQWAASNLANYPTFESFVKGWLTPESINTWVHFYPQHYFICDDAGEVKLDFVGRMENIEADFAVVANQVHCKNQLVKVNVGNQRHYSYYYTDELKDIVARVYARDIALFGYEFVYA
jgi:O-antigen/teichoic acid export membrane protein